MGPRHRSPRLYGLRAGILEALPRPAPLPRLYRVLAIMRVMARTQTAGTRLVSRTPNPVLLLRLLQVSPTPNLAVLLLQ